MSENEVIDTEAVESKEAVDPRQITITVDDQNVRYDTDMSVPEVVFWLDLVKQMVVKQVMDGEKTS